ncbi:MAG: DUF4880 domain-containing protein, partial [Opitutaceae bacterium]|nr:DUF4880 domain-containing protein [Opitutaceae bacterium]
MSPRANSDLPAPVLRAAGNWLARSDRGLSPEEQSAYARWLAEDPRHGQAIAQLSRTLAAFDRIRELAPAGIEDRAPDPDVFAPARRRLLRVTGSAVALAAAAALAVFLFRPSPPAAPGGVLEFTAAQAAERVTLADGSIINLNRGTTLTVALSATARQIQLTRGEAHF